MHEESIAPKLMSPKVRLSLCNLSNEKHLKQISLLRQLYEDSFPHNERRAWNELEQLIRYEAAYRFFFLEHSELGIVGFVTLWHFNTFYYGEHFAILPQLRNQHLGEQALGCIKEYIRSESLYFEVEPDILSQIARRRIGYYERNGFRIVKSDYLQPPYHPDEQGVPMYIMSSEQRDSQYIDRICKTIVERVYPVF
jgi:hypothetical protein